MFGPADTDIGFHVSEIVSLWLLACLWGRKGSQPTKWKVTFVWFRCWVGWLFHWCRSSFGSRPRFCSRRVTTARASSSLRLFDWISVTYVMNSGISHPKRTDAGRVLDTSAVAMISFPPMLILTSAKGYVMLSPCAHLMVT